MAKVRITGDTSDAQNKVRKLRQEVDRLDKQCRKPKKINVTGNVRGSGTSGGVGRIGSAMSVAGGNIISQIFGQLVQYVGAAARANIMIIGRSLGLKELEKSFDRVMPKLRSFTELLQTFGAPGETALERAYNLDALDDERRSHNAKTVAEEAAYSLAFNSVAGVSGTNIVDKIQNVLDQATSGNMAEMDRAWGQLKGFGVTWNDIEQGSTWSVLTKMLRAYSAAGADGQNELQAAMQQIVGKREMGAIRKIGDGTALQNKAAGLMAHFNERIPEARVQQILEMSDQAEFIDALRAIEGYNVPSGGLQHITNEAESRLQVEETKTGLIGNSRTARDSIKDYGREIHEDIKPAIDEIKNWAEEQGRIWSEKINEMLPTLPSWLSDNSNSQNSGTNNITENSQLKLAITDLTKSIQDNSEANIKATYALNNISKTQGESIAVFV